ncbi:zinc-binding dehydrogenase [Actinophytocola sp.]|uniref:zinc-binding dehydrogenase n=1 Tax=Actinophytocola sp. TaxID=1872138 RepID=UPI002D67E554|nr:zinc-binding dehydrogenase [Actinophytocola sp.]HYQ67792.1 zinc-binding dehydrogenase [Actinophytocola sp.]
MWALRQPAPYEFERIETPHPDPRALAPGEVLVRFRLGGICGSDLPTFAGVRSSDVARTGAVGASLHEIVGDVVASADDRLRDGDRVVGKVLRSDGLQEVILTAAELLHPLSDTLPDSEAVVAQPLATVLCALGRVGPLPGRRAAVLGLGPIGMLFCVVLKARGWHVTGVDRVDRTAEAATFGIDEPVVAQTGEWAAGLAGADRPDLVVDAIGHNQDVLADCVAAAGPHGEIYAFGLPEEHYVLPMREFFRKTLVLRAGATTNWPAHLAAAERFLVERRDLAPAYVTHTYRLADARDAYLSALRPAAGRLKISVVP